MVEFIDKVVSYLNGLFSGVLNTLVLVLVILLVGFVLGRLVGRLVGRLLHEFEENVARQGMDFTEYLKKIGKTRDELRLDFAPEAVKRVKVALAARQIAQEKNITLTATKPLLKHLAKIGYTPMEGARAIRRIIQEHIENPLAEQLAILNKSLEVEV